MIKEYIYNFLNRKLAKKKHDCIKLEWQRAELERKIANAKREHNIEMTAYLRQLKCRYGL